MKFLLFTSALAVVASSASAAHDGVSTAGKRRRIIPDKRRRISSTTAITFPEQVTEALELIQKGAQRGSSIQKLVAASKGGDDADDTEPESKSDSKSDGKSSSSSSKSSSSSGGSRRSGHADRRGGLLEGACNKPSSDDVDDCDYFCDDCDYYDCDWLDCPSSSKSSDVKTFIQKGAQRGSSIQKLVAASKGGDDADDAEADDGPESKSDSKSDGKSSSSSSKSSSSSGGSRRSGHADRRGGLLEGACNKPSSDDVDDCDYFCDDCDYYDCDWLDCPSTSKSSDGVLRTSKNLRRHHR